MPKQKCLSEETVEYMDSIWGFSHSGDVDNMCTFWNEAEYEVLAKALVESGAVEPNCKAAREMIAVAKALSQRTYRMRIDKLLKNYTVLVCTKCSTHHFIPSWCEPSDWIKGSCDGCAQSNCVVPAEEFYKPKAKRSGK